MNRFAAVVKEARSKSGLTLDALAKSTSTHKGYISGIEHGKVRPPAPNMTRRIARKLGLDPEEMVALGWWCKRPDGITLDLVRKVALVVLLCHSSLLFW